MEPGEGQIHESSLIFRIKITDFHIKGIEPTTSLKPFYMPWWYSYLTRPALLTLHSKRACLARALEFAPNFRLCLVCPSVTVIIFRPPTVIRRLIPYCNWRQIFRNKGVLFQLKFCIWVSNPSTVVRIDPVQRRRQVELIWGPQRVARCSVRVPECVTWAILKKPYQSLCGPCMPSLESPSVLDNFNYYSVGSFGNAQCHVKFDCLLGIHGTIHFPCRFKIAFPGT